MGREQNVIGKDWRFYLGLVLFVLHLVLPLLALIIVPMLGVSAAVGTVLFGFSVAGGPDLLLIAAAAIMGKDNLEYLFSKFGGWFKRLVRWDQVSPARYRAGVWLMIISIAVTTGFFYFMRGTLTDGDEPGWGYYVTIGADALFIVSFFVLGAGFWAKLTALFQYDARVTYAAPPESETES